LPTVKGRANQKNTTLPAPKVIRKTSKPLWERVHENNRR
jgi:hypothetical protein